jgi:hypothetical protein
MKNIRSLILMSLIGMLFFSEFAFGQTAPRSLADRESAHLAISPYAQAVPNDSYTFIGISHPSLTTAAARIGVVVEAVGMNTTVNTPSGRSTVFTVKGGETHRVFIVNQGHATINAANSAFTDTKTHIIPTVDTAQFGAVRVTTVNQLPNDVTAAGAVLHTARDEDDAAITCTTAAQMISTPGCGVSNLNQLNMWGIVYSEAAGTGFAMEFIGDMQDSKLMLGENTPTHKHGSRTANDSRYSRTAAEAAVRNGLVGRGGSGVN